MIGLHNPPTLSPALAPTEEKEAFQQMVYFPKETLSLTLLSCPQLASAHSPASAPTPSALLLLLFFKLCSPASADLNMSLLNEEVTSVKAEWIWSFTFCILHCPWCWARWGCSSMARLWGRCIESRDWLSSTDKVAYGTASAQQSFSWTYGWQLADSMFFSINPRSGRFRSHAPGTIRGVGQLRETRACRNRSPSRRACRRHWEEREWWVITTISSMCAMCVWGTDRLVYKSDFSNIQLFSPLKLHPFTSFVYSLIAVTQPHLETYFGLKSALFFPTVGLGCEPECCL